jgi:hypothetical protein
MAVNMADNNIRIFENARVTAHLIAEYQRMALDECREREATAWCEGLIQDIEFASDDDEIAP